MTGRDEDSRVPEDRYSENDPPGRADRSAIGNDSRRDGDARSVRDDGPRRSGPPRRAGSSGEEGMESDELLLFVRDVATSILAVALIGGYIFMISGVWPPMVAIESGSMEPNMNVNDLVFVMETDRFQPDAAHEGTGVVTAAAGNSADYRQFGKTGDVIVFNPQGNEELTPIIHRAMLYVEDGENWYDRADKDLLGTADNCEELVGCPAPNAGFITKGDDNPTYDQTGNGRLDPVKSEWVVGTAEYRIQRVGWFRLRF